MTNPIGQGTVTIGVNLPKAERELLGRLATAANTSIGALVKRLCLSGLSTENPAVAAEVREIRRRYYGGGLLGLLLLAIARCWFCGDTDEFRPNRIVRIQPGTGRAKEEAV